MWHLYQEMSFWSVKDGRRRACGIGQVCLGCNACANECPAGAIRKDEESLKAEDIGTYHDVFVLAEPGAAKRKGAESHTGINC